MDRCCGGHMISTYLDCHPLLVAKSSGNCTNKCKILLHIHRCVQFKLPMLFSRLPPVQDLRVVTAGDHTLEIAWTAAMEQVEMTEKDRRALRIHTVCVCRF